MFLWEVPGESQKQVVSHIVQHLQLLKNKLLPQICLKKHYQRNYFYLLPTFSEMLILKKFAIIDYTK